MQPLRILAAIFFMAAITAAVGAIALHDSLIRNYAGLRNLNIPFEPPTADVGIVLGLCIVSAVCAICSTWLVVTLFKSNEK